MMIITCLSHEVMCFLFFRRSGVSSLITNYYGLGEFLITNYLQAKRRIEQLARAPEEIEETSRPSRPTDSPSDGHVSESEGDGKGRGGDEQAILANISARISAKISANIWRMNPV